MLLADYRALMGRGPRIAVGVLIGFVAYELAQAAIAPLPALGVGIAAAWISWLLLPKARRTT